MPLMKLYFNGYSVTPVQLSAVKRALPTIISTHMSTRGAFVYPGTVVVMPWSMPTESENPPHLLIEGSLHWYPERMRNLNERIFRIEAAVCEVLSEFPKGYKVDVMTHFEMQEIRYSRSKARNPPVELATE